MAVRTKRGSLPASGDPATGIEDVTNRSSVPSGPNVSTAVARTRPATAARRRCRGRCIEPGKSPADTTSARNVGDLLHGRLDLREPLLDGGAHRGSRRGLRHLLEAVVGGERDLRRLVELLAQLLDLALLLLERPPLLRDELRELGEGRSLRIRAWAGDEAAASARATAMAASRTASSGLGRVHDGREAHRRLLGLLRRLGPGRSCRSAVGDRDPSHWRLLGQSRA